MLNLLNEHKRLISKTLKSLLTQTFFVVYLQFTVIVKFIVVYLVLIIVPLLGNSPQSHG